MSATNIAVVGMGTMGRAIALGLLRAGEVRPQDLVGTVRDARRVPDLQRVLDCVVETDNDEAVRRSEIVVLCTKPHVVRGVVRGLRDAGSLAHEPLLISIAAGVRIVDLEQDAGEGARVVRAMPNTPSLVGEGMCVLSGGRHATGADLEHAGRVFAPLGRVLQLDEEHLDAVTGLSGSGPAFVYVIIEALAEGGVMMGLPRKVATELAAQTVHGAARMVLETGRHPAELKDEVTTPAGCTISALLAMEDGRLRSVLARGVEEAGRRAAGLGRSRE